MASYPSGVATAAERGNQTREQLLLVAVEMMAEHGIEGVQLKEIQRAAGQRNSYAIGYHFGDREGLVRAFGLRYRTPANEERNRRLDHLERTNSLTIPNLTAALVEPLARNLDTHDGRSWLVVLAEAAHRMGTRELLDADRPNTDSITRLASHLDRLLPGSPRDRHRTISQAVLVTPTLLADIARDLSTHPVAPTTVRRRVTAVTKFVTHALASST
jgi:AcrR family transcriptional regulator